jgi:Leucine-rich repeat (LRR) protein
MNDRFAKLRTLLAQKGSKRRWRQVLKLFEEWPDENEREVALSYAESHLESWPEDIRTSPKQEDKHPGRILARYLELNKPISDTGEQTLSYQHITYLKVTQSEEIESWDWLSTFSHIKGLDLSECWLKDVDSLAGFTDLRTLNLSRCYGLKDVSGLKKLTKLTSLDMGGCESLYYEKVSKLGDALANLIHLEYLNLSDCGQFFDLDFLANMTKLHTLGLVDSHQNLDTVDALTKLPNLRNIDLFRCSSWADAHPDVRFELARIVGEELDEEWFND